MILSKLKSKFKITLAIFLVLSLIPLASAFGVTSPFWDKRPLVIHPGDEQQLTLVLQNMVGGEDLVFKASVTEGKDLAKITDADLEYSVPFGSSDVPVNLLISIPKDFPHGNDQKVGVSFTQIVTNQEGKMVQMGGGVKTIIPLQIVPLETSDQATGALVSVSSNYNSVAMALFLLLIVGIMAASIILVVKSKRDKPQEK